jgi:hypothetical protein
MTTSSPGRENAVMTCAASGPGPGAGPGAGVAGQTLTGTPIPGLAAVPDCCSPVPAGQDDAGGAGTGPE